MQPMILAPLIVTILGGGGFVVNEWSHGGLSESMGMGHHHMLDYDDPSCAKHGPMGHATHQPMNATEMCAPVMGHDHVSMVGGG